MNLGIPHRGRPIERLVIDVLDFLLMTGGLGHRYPSYPQSAAQYGIDTYSPQQGYNPTSQAQAGYNPTSQAGYNQQTPYSQQSAFYK